MYTIYIYIYILEEGPPLGEMSVLDDACCKISLCLTQLHIASVDSINKSKHVKSDCDCWVVMLVFAGPFLTHFKGSEGTFWHHQTPLGRIVALLCAIWRTLGRQMTPRHEIRSSWPPPGPTFWTPLETVLDNFSIFSVILSVRNHVLNGRHDFSRFWSGKPSDFWCPNLSRVS